MDDKLYLIDTSRLTLSTAFVSFIEAFATNNAVGIVTSDSASALPPSWIQLCKYIFASDGHECYVSNKLRYKNVLLLSTEVKRWIQASALPYASTVGSVLVTADPYISAERVRAFNELFSEYYAESCSGGFYISTIRDPRKAIPALISSNYHITFITSLADLGNANYQLAQGVMQRGRCYYMSNESDMQELLTVLSQE